MAQSNRDRVNKALDLLAQGLRPFIAREVKALYPDRWLDVAAQSQPGRGSGEPNWTDPQFLLKILWDQWNTVFNNVLGRAERSLVSELIEVRNRWAHNEAFSAEDAHRALHSIARLLVAVSAPEAEEVDRQKRELRRLIFEQETRQEVKRASAAAVEGQFRPGLRPWREIVTPHPDVASGRYQQAEFAADLGQVHRGEGADEYRDPVEFYRRTFLTEGLKSLLVNALRRLSGNGGDPVVELQTNFGGGKTHSMLALYHLCAGSGADLPGIEDALKVAEVPAPVRARRAVLVGTALRPAQTYEMADGTVLHTLWGQMAYQLLGREGYAILADSDRAGMNPGSDALRELFAKAAPCLILIDEWIAYVRMLYGVSGMPAGSFDANLTFAQSLTEAARAVPRCLVVASIPASDIEIGGEGGQEALKRLRNTFARMESSWRPATGEESFEIVRRRLFQPLATEQYPARDAAIRGFMELYRDNAAEFPPEANRADYERRMQAAYPIHPELFDRLYTDWSSLDHFQRTRGVLRLMAAVIHELWRGQDANLLIMPATVPVGSDLVFSELRRYLEPAWMSVVEKDVDGANSLPVRLDGEVTNLGRYSACRRVARTIFMGSAPTHNAATKGIEDRSIRLGCVQPGESVPIFGDALRRLTDGATHLYLDGPRYWFSTQQSVTKLAEERAARLEEWEVDAEIFRRIQEAASDRRQRGDFAGVHPANGSTDVADEKECRLVILGPEVSHSGRSGASAARKLAGTILESRGSGPRNYKNALVFLAADGARLAELKSAARSYLAWKSIEAESETLNLDAHQRNQARTKHATAEETVKSRMTESFTWLLSPVQPDPMGPIEWEETRLTGSDPLVARASAKLKRDGLLTTAMGGVVLRGELDKIPLWRDDQVSVRQLEEDYAKFIYLTRLKDPSVLHRAIVDGIHRITWEETFAYADGWDATSARYVGLRVRESCEPDLVANGLVVKPELALAQLEQDAARARPAAPGYEASSPRTGGGQIADGPERAGSVLADRPEPAARKLRRYHGSVSLNPNRIASEAGAIAQEVVQHLSALIGARVEVTLEIRAEVEDGIPESVVRTVSENSRTLRFTSDGFEEE